MSQKNPTILDPSTERPPFSLSTREAESLCDNSETIGDYSNVRQPGGHGADTDRGPVDMSDCLY